jgi:hypothetical protein
VTVPFRYPTEPDNVTKRFHVRPVTPANVAGRAVGFHLPHATQAGPLKAKVEPADSGE